MRGTVPDSRAPVRTAAAAPVALLLFVSPVKAGKVRFEQDIQPILTQHCVMCHLPGAAQGGHSLYPDARKSMVNVPSAQSPLLLVKPGDPQASYSYLKLTGEHLAAGGSGEKMPFPDGTLAAEQIDLVRRWIEEGARP